MNDFEFYLNEGDVRKRKPDMELAKSLLNDAKYRIEKASKLDVKEFSKMVFENFYDALRDMLDALLAADGYKSYSHEAAIAYLKKYGLSALTQELDSFRALRNASKYYGKEISMDSVDDIKGFFLDHAKSIEGIVGQRINNVQKNEQSSEKMNEPEEKSP